MHGWLTHPQFQQFQGLVKSSSGLFVYDEAGDVNPSSLMLLMPRQRALNRTCWHSCSCTIQQVQGLAEVPGCSSALQRTAWRPVLQPKHSVPTGGR